MLQGLFLSHAQSSQVRLLIHCDSKVITEDDRINPSSVCNSLFLQKEVYMIAAGVIAALFLICTVVMFLGVKERDGESGIACISNSMRCSQCYRQCLKKGNVLVMRGAVTGK